MISLDHQVLTQLRQWLNVGHDCWLNTIVTTLGSSPRPVGSLMACNEKGYVVGSLSGGCVEEDLIEKIIAGEFNQAKPARVEYGVTAEENERLGLPCGGRMEIVVEHLKAGPDQLKQLDRLIERLDARKCVHRQVELTTGAAVVSDADHYHKLQIDAQKMLQTFGPRYQLLLVGAGQLAHCLAEMAAGMDYLIRVCDPRPQLVEQWSLPEIDVHQMMPDDFVREFAIDDYSIVITLTHDPRIDDMALMEALKGKAFYVGALGSERTSAKRRERLLQLDLTEQEIARLYAPVGLSIGSKTPPEIAIAIIAQLTQLKAERAGRSAA